MDFKIIVEKRESGDVEKLRESGKIPAVVYGPEMKSISVAIQYNEFEKLYNEAGESSLIDLFIEGESKESTKVLIQDLQYSPVKGRITHIDFRQIKMGEEMNVNIELLFVGEALSVKELSGTVVKGCDCINVKCLQKDLVSEIEVDLGVLKTFDDGIKVSDLKIPAGIIVLDSPDNMVAKVSPPLTEEQLEAMEKTTTGNVEDVKVEGEEKKEGDEGKDVGGKEGDTPANADNKKEEVKDKK